MIKISKYITKNKNYKKILKTTTNLIMFINVEKVHLPKMKKYKNYLPHATNVQKVDRKFSHREDDVEE
jgi:hypothetical protein